MRRHTSRRTVWLVLLASAWPELVAAQLPFVTDDADVSPRGAAHIEVFNEYDWLQPEQRPHLRQNTLNVRVNYGATDHLELDLDAPLLMIVNTASVAPQRPFGLGDTNFGVKYNLREDHHGARGVAIAVASYIETPTGNPTTNLGSGVTDLWVYGVVEKALTDRTTLRANAGYLFAGNTSTGVVGITTTTRGHIATMGGSVVHMMTDRWHIGAEITAAATSNRDLHRGELQFLLGGNYQLRERVSLAVGLVNGHFVSSPRFGVQIGCAWDLRR